jgi:O-methyltransferase
VIKQIKKLLWKTFPDRMFSRRFPNNTVTRDRRFIDLFSRIYVEERSVMSIHDLYNIYTMVRETCGVPGAVAEVGVYRGGSAKLIAECKGERSLHLFDTFEGMPPVDASVDWHRAKDFNNTSLEAVRSYLAPYENVHFHKGYFPASLNGTGCDGLKYSFVNIDVDIYESTKSCLDFFYGRMSRGGVLVSHDYRSITCPGVKKAFDEFFIDKPERVVELWDSQCCVVKM